MLSRNGLAMGLAWHKSLQTSGQEASEASAASHVCREHAGLAVLAVAFPSRQGKAALLLLWCCRKGWKPAAPSLLHPVLVSLRGTRGSRPGKASGRAKLWGRDHVPMVLGADPCQCWAAFTGDRYFESTSGIAASTEVEMLPANAKSKIQRLVLLSKECDRKKINLIKCPGL